MDAEEGSRGARDEDADLVEEAIGWVEGAVVVERGGGEGEEEVGDEGGVDGVFGDVDEEEGDHAEGWD